MIAALYVQTGGAYFFRHGVDPWDETRDARTYPGPFPVVAHPPCERWGRFWSSDGSTTPGQDGGLFAAALQAVRIWGGVLEHPQGSHAWRVFDLPPAVHGAWSRGIIDGGWSTCVSQANYGHRATKLTWLYYHGRNAPPSLDWSDPGPPQAYLAQPGRCSRAKPRRTCPCDRCRDLYGDDWLGAANVGAERMGPDENAATPPAFVDLLLAIARGSR